MNIRLIFTTATLVLFFLSPNAHADIPRSSFSSAYGSSSDTRAYIGAAYGKVNHDFIGFEEPNSIEIYLGGEVSENLALEAAYLDLGDAGDNIPPEWTISIQGFTFSAIGKHQLSSQLELQAMAGLFFWDAELTEDGLGKIGADDGTDLFFGFGAVFKINSQVKFGGRYKFYDLDGDDVDVIQMQIQYEIN